MGFTPACPDGQAATAKEQRRKEISLPTPLRCALREKLSGIQTGSTLFKNKLIFRNILCFIYSNHVPTVLLLRYYWLQ